MSAIAQFSEQDTDVALFSKILQHKIEEQFWYVQQHVKETVIALYKGYLREKFPRVLVQEMQALSQEMISDQADLDPQVTKKVLQHMYEAADLQLLEQENTSQLQKYSQLLSKVLQF